MGICVTLFSVTHFCGFPTSVMELQEGYDELGVWLGRYKQEIGVEY